MDQLTGAEQKIYDVLLTAADEGQPCPINLDIEDLMGWSSTSMGPAVISKLEKKGWIKVRRYQRFRQVQICATGKWTAREEMQKTRRKHVPRGSGSMAGKLARKARSM